MAISDPQVASWALPLLQCPACQAQALESSDAALTCQQCERAYPVHHGIANFLANAHEAVRKERSAIARLDAGEVSLPVEAPPAKPSTDEGSATPDAAAAQAFERHVSGSRRQLQEVLAQDPLEAGSVVVELGADSCWASGLFLDRDCRVLAVDISDHLRLADRADDANLCRLNADMNDLPVADGSVDVVWATAAAHHSWDLAVTFREAHRVLRCGGRIQLCCEPMPSWLRYPFGLGVGDAERDLGINETWIPRSRWLQLADRAGFDAELTFPQLDDETMAERLSRRRLPRALIPLLRPVLRQFQVSIHLTGRKR